MGRRACWTPWALSCAVGGALPLPLGPVPPARTAPRRGQACRPPWPAVHDHPSLTITVIAQAALGAEQKDAMAAAGISSACWIARTHTAPAYPCWHSLTLKRGVRPGSRRVPTTSLACSGNRPIKLSACKQLQENLSVAWPWLVHTRRVGDVTLGK